MECTTLLLAELQEMSPKTSTYIILRTFEIIYYNLRTIDASISLAFQALITRNRNLFTEHTPSLISKCVIMDVLQSVALQAMIRFETVTIYSSFSLYI
jgi:hypothetical protein